MQLLGQVSLEINTLITVEIVSLVVYLYSVMQEQATVVRANTWRVGL